MNYPPLQVMNLNEAEFEENRKFGFQPKKQRKNLELADVMPTNKGLLYAAIASNMYLKVNGKYCVCEDFVSLFSMTNHEYSPSSLQEVRRNNVLIEGQKCLPRELSKILVDQCPGQTKVFIRCWEAREVFCWNTSLVDYLFSEDLLRVLPCPFGEFEIFDECNTWYMRIKDDDPIIFLATMGTILNIILPTFENKVLSLPRSFIYTT
ncbi:hypothetical protein [Gloeobacter morelensis]|uniref:Uncharacterized protein n=1 Tax=Gloeobacter morelensis MG652769 TaxID=2781736 RepID=A0ABY3PRG5_9CYAN|nr:hypothetical protein [Gloeobacter morelensis]UFP96138.1 hypothetical protein ISF26_08005 [Gloeobacter morelensis MG652769]